MEFDWLSMKHMRWIEMIRYVNRLKKMSLSRWPKKVYNWDKSLKANGWTDQVKHILEYANIDITLDSEEPVDLEVLEARLHRLDRNRWHLEAQTKTKLRTFVQIKDYDTPRNIINCNLSRNHRSLVCKLKMGTLPLNIECGRWKDVPLENRSCWACGDGSLENEMHFMLFGDAYHKTRTEYMQCIIDETDVTVTGSEFEIFAFFNKNALCITGRYLEKMFGEMWDILYKQLEEDES